MTDYKLAPVLGDGLLPCPFCGQPPTEYDQIGYSSVKCHECKFSIKVKSEDGPPYAPALWNRRAAPDVQGEPVATVTEEVFGSDGTSDFISARLPVGTKLYTAPQPAEPQSCPVCKGCGLNPLTEVPVACANCHGVTPAEQKPDPHPDDAAVDRFAVAMKDKLAASREKGRHGWQNATAPHLSALLYDHMYKADPLDVGNLAMMLHQNGQAIELPHEVRKTAAQPAPDVAALVEALERVMYCNEVWFLSESVQQSVSDALAAHRKGGE